MSTAAGIGARAACRPIDQVFLHAGDLPREVAEALRRSSAIACDTETTGLDATRDRLALCQVHADGLGTHLVRIGDAPPAALVSLIEDPELVKIFHHAPFDLRFMIRTWHCAPRAIRCTKVAAKILEPGRDVFSLRTLLRDHLGVTIDKTERLSDWQTPGLSSAQLQYAANDVRHLVKLFDRLMVRLKIEKLWPEAMAAFEFLPTFAALDLRGLGRVFEY